MHEPFTLAGDRDRAVVAEELSRAHTEGRLTLTEFDERTRAAYRARTYAELAALTADLPRATVEPVRRPADVAARVVTGAWLAASVVNLVVWGVVSLAVGEALHPWWIWVAGPWGLVLLAAHLARFGRSR